MLLVKDHQKEEIVPGKGLKIGAIDPEIDPEIGATDQETEGEAGQGIEGDDQEKGNPEVAVVVEILEVEWGNPEAKVVIESHEVKAMQENQEAKVVEGNLEV